MANIFTPTNWPNVAGPYAISIDDCMGDSVGIINANTNYLLSYSRAVSSTASTQITQIPNTIITTLSTAPYARLNDGNQTGSAPIFGIRAWVNFNGQTTTGIANASMTMRNNGNFSSVTRIGAGAGLFQLTFSIPLPHNNYCVTGAFNELNTGTGSDNDGLVSAYDLQTTGFKIATPNGGTTLRNHLYVYVCVVG